MLFAQVITEVPGYLNVVLQGGALVILAYHFLWGLPRMFDQVNADKKQLIEMIYKDAHEDRVSFEVRVALIAEELRKFREQGGCKFQP